MIPERWQQVKTIFYQASERAPSERAAFLDQACAGDAELRREVETLLAADAQEDEFLAQPLLARDEAPEKPTAELQSGQVIGHYRVEQRLGAGGMGVVYLATDTELGRPAALKLLPTKLTQDAARVRRFRQEARAASALNHPNILTIYEVGETALAAGSGHFIAAEFVDGRTLREQCREGGMRLGAALDLLIQVAGALSAAHEAGIVHRDVKPENIMLRRDGLVKMLDFGLAKLIEQDLRPSNAASFARVTTQPGVVMGTVSYMSPEQARGLDVDARSDLFSLGVVMYELLTGHAPFEGETTGDVLVALLSGEPRPLARYSSDLPAALQAMVGRTLAKSVEQRYQTAREIADDLKRLKDELEFAARLKGQTGTSADVLTLLVGAAVSPEAETTFATRQAIVPATAVLPRAADTSPRTFGALLTKLRRNGRWLALAALVLAVIVGIWAWPRATPPNPAGQSVAVLPFVNATDDPQLEYLPDGITEGVIDSLSRLLPLQVMARSAVFVYKGREDHPLEVGKMLGVGLVVTGRLQRLGKQYQVQLEMFRTSDGVRLWGANYQFAPDGLLALQEKITREIAGSLLRRLDGAEQAQLVKHQTQDSEAYALYMQGRFYWNKRSGDGINKSIEFFKQAITKDPGYALAYVGLADAYATLSTYHFRSPREVIPAAREAAAQALTIDERLAEAHACLGRLLTDYYWEWDQSDREFRRAIQLDPNYANAHHWYSTLLSSLGRFDESVSEARRAMELDHFSPVTSTQLGSILYRARRYDEAVAVLRKTLDLEPRFVTANIYLGLCYLKQEKYDQALAEFQKGQAVAPENPDFVALIGHVYAMMGQRDKARNCQAELEKMAKRVYLSPSSRGTIYAALGDVDAVLKFIEEAYEERSPSIRGLKTEPMYDSVRPDPRFQALMRRVNLAP